MGYRMCIARKKNKSGFSLEETVQAPWGRKITLSA